jgi:UDP:flavonoid glycosyltransferase YjiC (YdhE family)
MIRVLVGTMPAVGHVTPLLPLVRELVEAGHDVRWYTGSSFRPRVEATGATYLRMRSAPDILQSVATTSGRRLSAVAEINYAVKHLFADAAVGQVQDYREILRDWQADVCFSDSAFVGPAWLHELGEGPPWAVYNPMPMTLSSRDTAPFGLGLPPSSSRVGRLRNRILQLLFHEVLFRDAVTYVDMLRQRLGLRARHQFIFDGLLSPFLYLQGTIRAFEYPRSDLAPQVHFIGPAVPSVPPDFEPPAWWADLRRGQPVVHVTQGTIATEASHLLVPTLRALAGQDLLVVATSGGGPTKLPGLDALPANARIAPFIPHACLLPHVDVMVTNAGYNGVQVALAHGVPLVAAGGTEEKPEVAARIGWAGVGVNLRTGRPSERQLLAAVGHVLANPRYRYRARQMAQEIARHAPATEGATLVERLARTRRPVLSS